MSTCSSHNYHALTMHFAKEVKLWEMFFPPRNRFFNFTCTIFLEQQGLNLIIFTSWKLFFKKSRLHINWNHSIWMSKTQLMTQTLRLYQNQNRFRNSTSRIFWVQQGLNSLHFLLGNYSKISLVYSKIGITQFG